MDLLAWDAYIDSEIEATPETRRALLSSMADAVAGRARIEEVHEMNFLMEGQRRPTVGSILGLDGGINPENIHILYASVSAVLCGSVWGDHCSPISDTTILSSIALYK